MSNLQNEITAENLFARLEEVEGFMNLATYTKRQQELLRLLTDGKFEEAQEFVLELEAQYSFERHQALYEGVEVGDVY